MVFQSPRPTLRWLNSSISASPEEITGQQRSRVFAYKAYLKILNEGTEQPLRA